MTPEHRAPASWLRRAVQAAAWTAGLFLLGLAGLWWAGSWSPWPRPVVSRALPVAAPPVPQVQVTLPPPGSLEPAATQSIASNKVTLAPSPAEAPDTTASSAAERRALTALNRVRRRANLAPVQAQTAWTGGCAAHARYLVREDRAEHRQDPASPHHTAAGETCAPGHYFVSSQPTSGMERAVDYWASGAFHLPQLLDPRLTQVAFGEAHDGAGTLRSAAVLDVRRGLKGRGRYPVRYPAPGALMAAGPAAASEWPDPAAGCADQSGPMGAPLALLLGPDQSNQVRRAALRVNGHAAPACLLTASTFTGASASNTQAGRAILAAQGAALLLPGQPLPAGAQVEVRFVTARGPVTWTFRVAP
ncbi:hypothetical protein GO986_00915 [Deinococcus sp. HMF7620]|uniref:SCP domain-containing protein n=1 Tax=Deinococcus arboris TaxID=2682977 RepID=A0A7C9I822_9DEIO|nr:CAP domain-containing protein [Deinococcus arboris]MVN85326.1 hypothetical protein [Deinococcus arboris]